MATDNINSEADVLVLDGAKMCADESGRKISTIKPDHVTLGQCLVHQEFTRKYASIKDVGIVDLLRDSCKYNGFKDIIIDSAEAEGFANMHHILLLSSQDGLVTKELCVQRGNNINIEINELKDNCKVLTDINSVVIMIPGKSLDFHYFGKKQHSHFLIDFLEGDFKASLLADILTLEFSAHILIINFRSNPPTLKQLDKEGNVVLATAIEMVVTCKKSDNPILSCEYLHDLLTESVAISHNLLTDLSSGKLLTISAEQAFWISANDNKLSAYRLDENKKLVVCFETAIKPFFPTADIVTFVDFNYCCTTKQAFILYLKEISEEISSFILIFDANTLKVTKVLEMELTLNRRPQLVMYPLRDGSKLFVQEMFDNRVIFYQAFTLLPLDVDIKKISL